MATHTLNKNNAVDGSEQGIHCLIESSCVLFYRVCVTTPNEKLFLF